MLPLYYEYHNPVKILSGEAALENIPYELSTLGASAPMLLSDRGLLDAGAVDQVRQAMAPLVPRVCYTQVPPDSSVDVVNEIAALFQAQSCDSLLAVGGGSVIDTAKGVRMVLSHQAGDIESLMGCEVLTAGIHIPFIAVPTTAGTGSEATLAAVITDEQTHLKFPISDFVLIPDYAVLDASLTLTLPPAMTATTGMDALTHAVEAYIGRSTTPLTRAMAQEAVTLIAQNLRTAVSDGSNEEARNRMLRASYCAGIAFTRSYVGYVHAIAHTLGGQYGIAHGLANAVILPVVLRRYGAACEDKLAALAKGAGIADPALSDSQAALAFILFIEEMNREFGLPKGFEQIREEDIPLMAQRAANEGNPLYPVPVLMDAQELAQILRALML